MFAVIYRFKVKQGCTKDFLNGWEGLTKLIYEYEGSLGSRVHRESESVYIAYAQWPSKERWENAGSNMPEEANKFRKLMKESCIEITTEHELECVVDLLKSVQHN